MTAICPPTTIGWRTRSDRLLLANELVVRRLAAGRPARRGGDEPAALGASSTGTNRTPTSRTCSSGCPRSPPVGSRNCCRIAGERRDQHPGEHRRVRRRWRRDARSATSTPSASASQPPPTTRSAWPCLCVATANRSTRCCSGSMPRSSTHTRTSTSPTRSTLRPPPARVSDDAELSKKCSPDAYLGRHDAANAPPNPTPHPTAGVTTEPISRRMGHETSGSSDTWPATRSGRQRGPRTGHRPKSRWHCRRSLSGAA